MTTSSQKKGSSRPPGKNNSPLRVEKPGKLKASPTLRHNGAATRSSVSASSADTTGAAGKPLPMTKARSDTNEAHVKHTAIEQCVQHELRRYFDMLDGEEPANLYRMVIRQAECALVNMVMEECRGNQTRASEWLGISRGNLRTKLASMEK